MLSSSSFFLLLFFFLQILDGGINVIQLETAAGAAIRKFNTAMGKGQGLGQCCTMQGLTRSIYMVVVCMYVL